MAWIYVSTKVDTHPAIPQEPSFLLLPLLLPLPLPLPLLSRLPASGRHYHGYRAQPAQRINTTSSADVG